jgi:hypothetical protein
MTTQAPSRPPASYESGFFSALMLRRWLTRVSLDRDSSGNRPTGSGATIAARDGSSADVYSSDEPDSGRERSIDLAEGSQPPGCAGSARRAGQPHLPQRRTIMTQRCNVLIAVILGSR